MIVSIVSNHKELSSYEVITIPLLLLITRMWWSEVSIALVKIVIMLRIICLLGILVEGVVAHNTLLLDHGSTSSQLSPIHFKNATTSIVNTGIVAVALLKCMGDCWLAVLLWSSSRVLCASTSSTSNPSRQMILSIITTITRATTSPHATNQ